MEGRVVREWQHSFYTDSDAEIPLERGNDLSLGDVREGEPEEKTIYIRNEENAFVRDITYKCANENIEIVGPKSLYPQEVAPITITWIPYEDVEGLNVKLWVEGDLVFG